MQKLKISIIIVLSFIFVQCSKDYDILKNIEGITIVVDGNVKQLGQSTEINLIDNEGVSLTNDARFYVNGQAIEGNAFVKNEVGTYVITAKYENLTAENSVTIQYVDGTYITFKPHVLVEDFTGTWCGNCPRVVYRLNQIEQELDNNPDYTKDQLVKVAIHRGNPTNTNAANYDPFNFDSSVYEANYFSGGYPKAAINRNINWPNPQSNVNLVIQQLQDIKRVGLALETHLIGNVLNVKVKSFFAESIPGARLVVYVLENGLIHNQTNYSTLYPIPGSYPAAPLSPLVNFIHNHTLRLCQSADMLGDPLNALQNSELLNEYNFEIPSNFITNNLEVVAFITNSERTTINARKIKINEAPQVFQIN